MILVLQNIAAGLHVCNWHACLYLAFGLVIALRSVQARHRGDRDEAREYGLAGFVHATIGVLTFLHL